MARGVVAGVSHEQNEASDCLIGGSPSVLGAQTYAPLSPSSAGNTSLRHSLAVFFKLLLQ